MFGHFCFDEVIGQLVQALSLLWKLVLSSFGWDCCNCCLETSILCCFLANKINSPLFPGTSLHSCFPG